MYSKSQSFIEFYHSKNIIFLFTLHSQRLVFLPLQSSSLLKVNLVKSQQQQEKKEELSRKQVSFDFRTLQAKALLLYHSSETSLKITLDNSRLQVAYQELAIIDSFDMAYNDGKWHSVALAIQGSFVNLTVDNEILVRKTTQKDSEFGSQFLIGGNHFEAYYPGFIGCLKNIQLLGFPIIQLEMDGIEHSGDILEDRCVIDDKCVPNPCQHGGLCKQNSTAFTCECENGYGGPLCHTSINYRSCHDFALANPDTRYIVHSF